MVSPANSLAPALRVESRILVIRGQKVMIDADLAELYGVPTKALNQAVKRNAARFPEDFMFRLSPEEKREVVTNCDHLARLKFSKALPFAGNTRAQSKQVFEALRQLMAQPAEPPKRPIGFVVPQEKKGKG